MSYTSADQVRHHLVTPYPLEDRVTDQRVVLDGIDSIQFYGGAVESSSLLVKSVHTNDPTRVSLTLNSQSTPFASGSILNGSVVVASDSSLGTIYIENIDYVIDYTAGTLAIKGGGSLSGGMQVSLWFVPFTIYQDETDYDLQADRGEIKRLAGGTIAAGETVYLDYVPIYVSFTDEIVDNAVAMANGMVENEVDPDGQFEADHTLSAAATYRALEIVCRAAASRELAGRRGTHQVALGWIKLADDFITKADRLMRAFHPPFDNPRPPVRS